MTFLRWTGLGAIAGLFVAAACNSSGSGGGSDDGGTSSQSNDGGVTSTLPDGASAEPDAGGDGGPLTSGNPTGLWVGGLYAYSVTALGDGGLTADGAAPSGPPPSIEDDCPVPNSGASTAPAAFDGAGNLWVEQAGDSTIALIMWSASQLAAACSSGTPARTITLSPHQALDQISAMAFDKNGTLWLSFIDYAALAGVTSSQLAASGSVSATYFIQYGGANAQQLHAPNGLAVDAAGNLWVANLYSVLEYSQATLATALTADSGGAADPTADAYLSTAASEAVAQNLNGTPSGLAPTFTDVAFDKSGNLWVSGSDYTSQTNSEFIAEYAASDLTKLGASTTPTPVVVLQETADQIAGFASFGAIAFDATGNLWLGSNADLYRFPASSLVPGDGGVGGTYDIAALDLATLTGKSLTFNPIPAGLPIQP